MPSTAAWYRDRPVPMIALSTDRSKARISGKPMNHLIQLPWPNSTVVKSVYSVSGSMVVSAVPSTPTKTSGVRM